MKMLTLWATRIHGDSHMNTMSVLGCRSSDSKYECEYQCNNGKSACLRMIHGLLVKLPYAATAMM